jgi:predicted dehydrogenase
VIPDTPDVAFVNAEYGSGVIAHVELAWLAPSKLRRTTVVGSRKMVVYDDTSGEPVRVFDSGVTIPDPDSFGEFRLSYRTGDIVSPRVDAAEPLSLELADLCACIRCGREPRSNSTLGLDVLRVVVAAERSLRTGGVRTPVEVAGTPLGRI